MLCYRQERTSEYYVWCSPSLMLGYMIKALVHVCATKLASTFLLVYPCFSLVLYCARDMMLFYPDCARLELIVLTKRRDKFLRIKKEGI